ncbi:MAG: amidohydrolase, partial [Firmicutes bacterium]|nr:amidohydrolase [Bacillota bacterium]
MTRYIAAALQFEPAWGEKGRNLVHLSALIEEAARQGARLVVAPEMVTTGYIFGDPSEVAPLAESIPGPTTLRLGELARRHSLYLVVGLPEVDEERGFYYNS